MTNVVPIRRAGSPGADALLVAPTKGSHLAHFYEDDRALCDVVGRFIGAGLRAGDRAVIIATQEHACSIAPHLADAGIAAAVESARLLFLDASETLGRITSGGSPDRSGLRAVIAEMLDRVTAGTPGVRVRVFSEMMDVLCRRGQRLAAIQLEEQCNAALRQWPVSLLCGYVMSSFYDGRGNPGEGFADVCRLHTHVLPPESFAQVERSAEPLVEISRLSDTARLIEAERRFRLLVASVRDYAVFTLDPHGNVATWNAGAERIKGWKAGEIVGRHCSVLHPPQDVDLGKCELALAIAAEKGRHEDVGWRIRKDGTFFWAHVVITALRENGQLVGFAKVTRDLKTHAHMAPASLRELSHSIGAMQVLLRQLQERRGRATAGEMRLMAAEIQQMGDIVEALSQSNLEE